MTADLYITDGTTRINLLSGIDGFHLVNWTPTIPPVKQVWRESPLTDGRKLAMSRWANATETFSLRVARFTQDDIIQDLQELRRLLLAAREYFIGGSDVPVWLERRGDCETNTGYAVICDWRAETDDDPFHKPFALDNPAVDNFTLILERQHWRHLPPGQSECVELSATQDYYVDQDGTYYPTESGDDCYVDTVGATISLVANIRLGRTAASAVIYGSGIRFRSVAIPQGAYIIRAYIKLTPDANLAANNVNSTIAGDDVDSAAIFTTYANFAGRARTAATVAWSAIGAWTLGVNVYTPFLTTIVQEIVSRAGWVSGNPMAFLFDDDTSTAAATRTADAWDAAGANEPYLYVAWFDTHTGTFGRTATCNNEVYVANKHNMAQITHVYVDDGGAFGANLQGGALPYALFPAIPVANDAVYFGIATVAPNSGPFCSLVFDIGTVNDGDTIVWEYWNGAWVALGAGPGPIDNTNANGLLTGNPFDTAGVNSVHWEQLSDWVTTAVNGITGYWVRARVTVIGGLVQAATQQNRDVYTIVTPFIDTTAANIVGDIQALANLRLYTQSSRYQPGGGPMGTLTASDTYRVWAGLRSYSRGANFTPYINLSDEQNNANITITAVAPAAFASSVQTPTGRYISYAPGIATAMTPIVSMLISNPLSEEYFGEYRCFIRGYLPTGLTLSAGLQIGLYAPAGTNPLYLSDTKYLILATGSIRDLEIIDMGKLKLPPGKRSESDTYKNLRISIQAVTLSVAAAIGLTELILIPCDECFFDTQNPNIDIYSAFAQVTGAEIDQKRLEVSSITPRIFAKSKVVYDTTGFTTVDWILRNNSPVIYQPNERQRWWFFSQAQIPVADLISSGSAAYSAQSWVVSRYLSMRGNR